MYFNIDGLKPVTSESSLDVLYFERNRINKLIEEKEKEISKLQKQIYETKHGKHKDEDLIIKNKFTEDKNWFIANNKCHCCRHAPTISWIKEN